MSQHSASEDIEHKFVSPRMLFRNVYSDLESGPQSEEADNQINDGFDKQKSSDKDTDSNSEIKSSTTKKLRLSRSCRKLINGSGCLSCLHPGRLLLNLSKRPCTC